MPGFQVLAHDVVSRLRLIECPTLVICGDQDFCCPISHSKEIANHIPHSQFAVISDAGHLLHVEKENMFLEEFNMASSIPPSPVPFGHRVDRNTVLYNAVDKENDQ
jgi:esterase/lipase